MSDKKLQRGWIAWMARNPVAANLLMAVLLAGGFFVTMGIRQEVFPEFEIDTVVVTIPYPGASPTDVENGVLLAVEEQVRGIDGVDRVTSVAREGSGTVAAELLIGANKDKVLQDIKSAVDRITSFPQEIERPTVSRPTPKHQVIDLVIYGGQDEAPLRRLADDAREGLLRKPSISVVELTGVRPFEIAVEVSQQNLRTYGLTLGGIADVIRRHAMEMPGGGVKTKSGEILVRMDERRDLGREFGDIPVVTAADGTTVKVSQIARIVDGFADTDEAGYFSSQPGPSRRAVTLSVYRIGDQTPLEVAAEAREFVDEFRQTLPPGYDIATLNDRSEVYGDRLRLLLKNALLGLILVLVVLGIFLELRLAFWVTLGIPISFLGAILLLPAMDVSINMISMFAFIMALGMVVDDAIVVGENIYEMRQKGMSYLEAAIRGARQILVPVVFAVLTNMVAFAPIFFVPGFMGKIFWVIPAIIIPVFFISLVECLFILPAHLGHQRPPSERGVLVFFSRQRRRLSGGLAWLIEKGYGPVVRTTLRWRYLTVATGLGILIVTIGFVAGGHVKIIRFPRIPADYVRATVELKYGAPVSETRKVVDRLVAEASKILLAEEKRHGKSITRGIEVGIGRAPRRGGPGGGGSSSAGGHAAYVRVNLVPSGERRVSSAELEQRWRRAVGKPPGVDTITYSARGGPGVDDPINIELSHRDTSVLEAAAADLARALGKFDGVKDIDDGVTLGKPQLNFTVSPEAESLGLTTMEIGRQVRHAFYGAEALRQQRGRDEVKVMVRLPEAERKSQHNIDELIIRTPSGGEIPLRDAAVVKRTRAYTVINRRDGRRVLNVTADVDTDFANAQEVVSSLDAGALPELVARYPGLSYSLEGARRDWNEAMAALRVGFFICMCVIFAMIAIPLRSYVQPFIIMTAIPFGIVGAVLGHLIMGYDLSLMSMMGIVALAGVVVNDSLILICTTNDRRSLGARAFDAVNAASVRRFRPIILTSLTTFFGLAPMIFETSRQARFLIPMALSLGFGVLMATFITLLLVPSLYLIVEDLKRLLLPAPEAGSRGQSAL